MTQTIAIMCASLLLGACASAPTAPVPAGAPCEAMRPGFPMTFSASRDTPETIAQIRANNLRFQKACP